VICSTGNLRQLFKFGCYVTICSILLSNGEVAEKVMSDWNEHCYSKKLKNILKCFTISAFQNILHIFWFCKCFL